MVPFGYGQPEQGLYGFYCYDRCQSKANNQKNVEDMLLESSANKNDDEDAFHVGQLFCVPQCSGNVLETFSD